MVRNVGPKAFFGFIGVALLYILAGGILSSFTSGRNQDPIFDEESAVWVASSPSLFDRSLCYWLGLCGGLNFLHGSSAERIEATQPFMDFSEQWISGSEDPSSWSQEEQRLRKIPQYVLDHAPYVHLYSKEQFWPADPAEHLAHTSPHLNYTTLAGQAPSLEDLYVLNDEDDVGFGKHVHLQSLEDVEGLPTWLSGRRNIPSRLSGDAEIIENMSDHSPSGRTRQRHRELRRSQMHPSSDIGSGNHGTPGRSTAPAFLIVIPKEDGVIDAFWFFFYSFNQAPKVFNIQFGNHVGDWEHTVIRFRNGIPESVSPSAHFFGTAYTFDALEKYLMTKSGEILSSRDDSVTLDEAIRPVIYSAGGSHAMYPSPGLHPYILPFGVLRDETDRGPLWDPTLNLQAYTYDLKKLRASTLNPRSPTGWFNFLGRWGDKYYKLSDPRQYRFAGQYHYLHGPQGPKTKHLERKHVCQGKKKCVVKDALDA